MINTDAENCATCGAEAKTGYMGDDFAFGRLRAVCSDLNCYRSTPFDMRADESNILLTVAEWNVEQRELRATMDETRPSVKHTGPR